MGLLDDAYTKAKHIAGLLSDYYQTGAQIYFPNKADVSARKKVAGLLSDRAGDAYDYLGKRASVIAADPLGELARAVDNTMGGEYNRQLNQRATLGLDAVAGSDQTNASLQSELNRKLLDVALNGITVWHGSPHKFDKFDMSKIGTGEGAQAYGHGLYMAESPRVAGEYAEKLTVPELLFGGRRVNEITDAESKKLADWISSNVRVMKSDSRASEANRLFNRLTEQQKIALGKPEITETGNLYKVDIPDEAVARMLDWDKPLSQQAPEVQKMLEPLGYSSKADVVAHDDALMAALFGDGSTTLPKIKDPMGSDIARGGGLFDGPDQVRKAKMLRDLGIPGIRYLDGGSRAGGKGTSNYVLFSDQLPRILEVNGKPTGQIPWSPGEWKGLLGQ